MAYYTDLFSPDTYEAFTQSDQSISGFRPRQKNAASKIKPGDKLVCYVTKISRWVGILEVTSECFESDTPLFYSEDDPFVIRFRVKPLVWLPKEKAVPIHENRVWEALSFTQSHEKNSSHWTGKMRNSLNLLSMEDGQFLEELLERQEIDGHIYELDEAQYRKLVGQRIRREDKMVSVSVPQEDELEKEVRDAQTIRESYQIQALLARIGEAMEFTIWLPRSDRSNVLQEWTPNDRVLKVMQEIQRPVFSLLERAPLSEICSFISYDSVRELSDTQHLSHLLDSVLEEYAEEA